MTHRDHNIFEINIGDWSDDGHGKTLNYLVYVPKEFTFAMIAENYKKNCEKYGLTLGKPMLGYDDHGFPLEALKRMIADGLSSSILIDNSGEEDDTEVIDIYRDDFFDIACHMFFHGMPENFTWEEIKSDGVLLGGYSAIENSAGYGLFY